MSRVFNARGELPTSRHPLDYLTRLCRRWGGGLVLCGADEFHELLRERHASDHPTGTHGCNWRTRVVFARTETVDPGAVIHEMGHVFLAEGRPDHPDFGELDWLGWEIALARRARCYLAWSAQNTDYIINWHDVIDWGALEPGERRTFCQERITHALQLGLITATGRPLCTVGAT